MKVKNKLLVSKISEQEYNAAVSNIFMCLFNDRSYEFREDIKGRFLFCIEKNKQVTYYKIID
jgi:hypothetical protein